mmetsp:Transcript_52771/g.103185  ORF Transcript_52771/g.103185 Transcript_52771/m.103185 type:complete len:80 (-) Transcript_52771:394-633(-)
MSMPSSLLPFETYKSHVKSILLLFVIPACQHVGKAKRGHVRRKKRDRSKPHFTPPPSPNLQDSSLAPYSRTDSGGTLLL